MKAVLLLKKLVRHALPAFFLLFSLFACQDDICPTTGDLVINVNAVDLIGSEYNIYTEAYLNSETYTPPIKRGTIQDGIAIKLSGLNPGNYLFIVSAGYYSRTFQVTAGQEKIYYITYNDK